MMKSSSTASEISKLQVVCSLFSKTVGEDLYYAKQIKESIDAAIPQNQDSKAEAFVNKAQELSRMLEGEIDLSNVEVIQAAPERKPYSMLDLRAQLLTAAKATCQFNSGLVILTGLKEAICPQGKRWSKRRKKEYEEAVHFARSFFQSRTRPSTRISLIIF